MRIPSILTTLLLSAPLADATVREIPVPNGSFETMFSPNGLGDFTIPYALAFRGITRVPIGGDKWGEENTKVHTVGWYGVDVGVPSHQAIIFKFSPMHFESGDFPGYDPSVNGRVIAAVNSHDTAFGAADLKETVQTGAYTLMWGSGWNVEVSTRSQVPSVVARLQYSLDDGVSWRNLEGAAESVVTNKESLDAEMEPGEFRNDYFKRYRINPASPALGGRMRVFIPCAEADSSAYIDNLRLNHASEGAQVDDLAVVNPSMELMYAVPIGLGIPDVENGEEPFTEEDYSNDYRLTKDGVTRVPFGGDDWQADKEQVWTVGWESTAEDLDFSPMSTLPLNFGESFSTTDNGYVVQRVNAPTGQGSTAVRGAVQAGVYYLTWGAGWPADATAFQDCKVELEYSIDNGLNWFDLGMVASRETNLEAISATLSAGSWSNAFQTSYQVEATSQAVGGLLRVAISASASATGSAIVDRYRVGYATLDAAAYTRGPGVFQAYELIADGYIHGGSWLGWIWALEYPWLYQNRLSKWIYLSEASASSRGAWCYIPR